MAELELELKLTLPLKDFDRFRRDPLIHRAKQGRARSQTLLAVYFDTETLALRQNRCALRIRQENRDRIQTLKISEGGAGIVRRVEHNAPTDSNLPDLGLIEDETVRASVAEWIGDADLQPIFSTDVRRTTWDLKLADGLVEVALDQGIIISGARSSPVAEIELELKAGKPTAILDLALQIAERYDIHIHDRSKASRGYGLFHDAPPEAQRARKLKLDAEAPIWASLGQVIESGAAQLFANEAAILHGNDVDGIHQARVAVRRIRAALSAFRDVMPDDLRKNLAKPLQKLQVGLGPARDWDVFLTETLIPMLEEVPPDKAKALSKFILRVENAKQRAYKSAFKVLRKPAYGRLQLALVQFPHLPAPGERAKLSTAEAAGAHLEQRYQVVRAAAGIDPSLLPEVALHDLRIDIKKFRYALDFLRSLYPKDVTAPWRSAAKALQDCLGGLNDTVIQAALLDAMEAPDRPVPKSVRSAIHRRNQFRATADLERLSGCWETFNALEPFWRATERETLFQKTG